LFGKTRTKILILICTYIIKSCSPFTCVDARKIKLVTRYSVHETEIKRVTLTHTHTHTHTHSPSGLFPPESLTNYPRYLWSLDKVFSCMLEEGKTGAAPQGPRKSMDAPSSYRPICLLDTPGKLLEKLLVQRLESHFDAQASRRSPLDKLAWLQERYVAFVSKYM